MRDVNYMCEAVTRDSKSWWTIDGGYCLPYPLPYQTLGLDLTTVSSKCTFSLKCALSNSLDQNCNCKNVTACRKAVDSSCANWHLLYPTSGPLLSPYAYMLYERDRDWTKKIPDMVMYHGRVKCIGYQIIITSGRWALTLTQFHDYRESENLLCNIPEGTKDSRNYSGPHYDANCWNNSKTYTNRPYQVSFHCETRCISKYRVRDGIRDCYQNEELYTINNSCPQIQRHRLQCSPSELTCLLAGSLGTWGSSCSNSRDEFDSKSGIVLLDNLRCHWRTDPGCAYLRDYIRTSSYDNTNKTTIANNSILDDHSTTTIPFRSYCNSFFETKSGIDESPQLCEKWVCFSDEHQCLSGQCISQSWVCDGTFSLLIVSFDFLFYCL
jgi:hypothetical protein